MPDVIQAKLDQKRLLIPLTFVLVALGIGFGFTFLISQNTQHGQIRQDLLEASIKNFSNSLIDQTRSLSALAFTLARDKKLQVALKEQDR